MSHWETNLKETHEEMQIYLGLLYFSFKFLLKNPREMLKIIRADFQVHMFILSSESSPVNLPSGSLDTEFNTFSDLLWFPAAVTLLSIVRRRSVATTMGRKRAVPNPSGLHQEPFFPPEESNNGRK